MSRFTVSLNAYEDRKLKELAEREHREPGLQIDFMTTVLLDVFAALPEYMERADQTEVLLALLKDVIQSEQGQAFIAMKQRADELQHLLDKIKDSVTYA
jgi:hypothetical protein